MEEPLIEKPKPWWKKLLELLIFTALIGGLYHAWQTGAILKAFDWLTEQDPILLTVIAVAVLMALAVGLGGD